MCMVWNWRMKEADVGKVRSRVGQRKREENWGTKGRRGFYVSVCKHVQVQVYIVGVCLGSGQWWSRRAGEQASRGCASYMCPRECEFMVFLFMCRCVVLGVPRSYSWFRVWKIEVERVTDCFKVVGVGVCCSKEGWNGSGVIEHCLVRYAWAAWLWWKSLVVLSGHCWGTNYVVY